MRLLASALLLASLAGCKVVPEDTSIDRDLLAGYDVARLSAGDWAEYATSYDGDDDPEHVLRYACVAVEPGTAWVEVTSKSNEETTVLALDPATGAVKRCWRAAPGKAPLELYVKSIGEAGAAPKVSKGHRLEVSIAAEAATHDGKTLAANRITTVVHTTEGGAESVEATLSGLYSDEVPFPIAWNRTLQQKGPGGGLLILTKTEGSDKVETRLLGYGHDAKRTVEVR